MYIAWCCAEPASELLAPWKWRELSSPSPGPLPKGEGELSAAWRQIEASRQLARRTTEHPLTGGVAEAKPDSRISVTPAARRSRKPEDRRSKAERRPKSENRRADFGLRVSAFGFLSAFGLRVSGLKCPGPTLEQPCNGRPPGIFCVRFRQVKVELRHYVFTPEAVG